MQIITVVPDDARGRHFLGFTPQTTPEQALQAFQARYGRPPAYLINQPNILLAGPAPGPSQTTHRLGAH
ncbi:MAG: hypothetical protein FJ011_26400 [Chloroflexi bacterium]|nr:hypothetical protein [Chloroflexota bacterium]